MRGDRVHRKRGQAILFLLAALVALTILILCMVDVHRFVQRKNDIQNAGDAAVLAAARWQGLTLNLEGELNLMHVLACIESNKVAEAGITNMQKRIAFSGPLAGFLAGQVAAKQNHIKVDDDMTTACFEHAAMIATVYNETAREAIDETDAIYPEPWEGAWGDYATMVSSIATEGIAASVENVNFFATLDEHILYSMPFYNAVLGEEWCWFYFNAMSLLKNYVDYHDWPALPVNRIRRTENTEILCLGLTMFNARLEYAVEAMDAPTGGRKKDPNVFKRATSWMTYASEDWGEWTRFQAADFPVRGPLRSEYNVSGASAVMRVNSDVARITPGTDVASLTWLAAAKAFGYLDSEGAPSPVTRAAGYVLPAFRAVRLIPVDAAYEGAGNGTYGSLPSRDWMEHVRKHVPFYIETGSYTAGCRWCSALRQWDMEFFRKKGVLWLDLHSKECNRDTGTSGGFGNGASFGH